MGLTPCSLLIYFPEFPEFLFFQSNCLGLLLFNVSIEIWKFRQKIKLENSVRWHNPSPSKLFSHKLGHQESGLEWKVFQGVVVAVPLVE